MDYGYVTNGQAVGCTPQELMEAVVHRNISFVWTPETPTPVRPEQLPFLMETFRHIEARNGRNLSSLGMVLLAIGVVIAFLKDEGTLLQNVVFVVGAFLLSWGNWKYWRARNFTQEDVISNASYARFIDWIKPNSVSGYTLTLLASIIVVTILQGVAPDAIALAALVKSNVWDGEVWRLFTATLMHGKFEHVLLNAVSLVWLSKIIGQTLPRALVLPLFLVSAVVGNVFSVVLSPDTSMGASGGMMGLMGFIVVAAYFDRTNYPQRFFKHMWKPIATVFAFSLFGLSYFDNAAHLGGLVTGALLGLLYVTQAWAKLTGKPLRFAGVVGTLAIVFTAIFAISRLIS
ncbi:MAG TPA: rhomboid family intramembrane serine protease [Pyrinomonadaceae bacterium]|nr:rhomboid family intramembrane serine protease [Pyrinomonadaceae bacterium]